ncbi:hypothetical protein BGZ63DRAFT_88008 [Mariannaea sp. PMI_226]|nr:hypothetical protein BGZ63DRAFT_88008 [Mariannaea sp. PMI_226]
MPTIIGPFDRRRKRFRCRQCTVSHLKCSGNLPCSNCDKRGVPCSYPDHGAKTRVIQVDKANQKTAASFAFQVSKRPNCQDLLLVAPKADLTYFYLHYFDVFLQRNNFGQRGILAIDTKDFVRSSAGETYLRDAILSLGAITSFRLQSHDGPTRQENYRFALTSYAKSVAGLRDTLGHDLVKPQPRLNVLWTTLILGLFELMTDASGEGWIKHLVHGTSKALVACGPQTCRSGPGQRFFMEIKIFEVCRSVVYNEPSFLLQPGWKELSNKSQADTQSVCAHPLDELLNIIVCCSSLLVRAKTFIGTFDPSEPTSAVNLAHKIALEGFRQREALTTWNTTHANFLEVASPGSGGIFEQDDFASLAVIYHAATSIYLSGIYDYDIVHWNSLGTLVSTLSEDEVQMHVGNILRLSQVVLDQSRISPLLLLFPLRVAGSRSRELWQRENLLKSLQKIGVTFCVADAFRDDLQELWREID